MNNSCQYLAKAEWLLAAIKNEGEDSRRSRCHQLRSIIAAQDIRRAGKEGLETSVAWWLIGVKLAKVERRYRDVLLLAHRIAVFSSRRRVEAMEELADTYLKIHEYSKAERVVRILERIGSASSVKSLSRKVYRQASKPLANDSAYYCVQELVDQNDEGALNLYQEWIKYSNYIRYKGALLGLFSAILTLRERLCRSVTLPRQDVRKVSGDDDIGRMVFVSGFNYSGSGAVFDFLKAIEGVRTPIDDKKVALFQGMDRSLSLHSISNSEIEGEPSSYVFERILKFLFLNVFGVALPPDYGSKRMASLYRKSLFVRASSTTECRERLIERVSEEVGTCEAAEIGGLGVGLLSVFLGPSLSASEDIVLFNNNIKCGRVEVLKVFENARVIFVVRDPCDQYYDHIRSMPDKRISVEKYIQEYRAGRRRLGSVLSDQEIRNRVSVVRFEEFVSQEETRRSVLEWLGLPEECAVGPVGDFDPRRSAKNIDLPLREEEPEAYKDIRNALKEYSVF
ncbi:sulfotransferase [Gammaproteobacteria bacterium AB-CW1]|uniref:Sulfotransferase n=1 Tax=Natronospira elongata TaxID=3110268 RepID=A0AAP6JHH5_9GAMM|nr:sulfotransferase [Gammaproteobacteria bacterium AB-CW1]